MTCRGDIMTKQQFERAKELEIRIKQKKEDLEILHKSTAAMQLFSVYAHRAVDVPNSCKMAIYKQVKEVFEKELEEMEREFSELVSD